MTFARIRIPFLLDLVRIQDRQQLAELNAHPRIRRDPSNARHIGPLLTRGRLARIADTFRTDRLLPAFLNREAEGRAEAQTRLESDLAARFQSFAWAEGEIEDLAWGLREGRGRESLGPLCQQICGRLFFDKYKGDHESYAAAQLLDDFPRANLLTALRLRLSGELGRAKALLWARAQDDPHCIHATTIAFHNLVKAVTAMHRLRDDPAQRARLTAESVVGHVLVAPETLLRVSEKNVELSFLTRPTSYGTLFVVPLQKLHEGTADSALALQRDAWSRCPAHAFVPALLEEIWRRAFRQGAAS